MWCPCVPGGAQGPGLPLQKTRPQAASSGPRGAVLSESSVMLSQREHCELSELTGLHPQVGSQRPLGKAPARGLRSAIIGGAESPSLSRSVLPVPSPALRGRPRVIPHAVRGRPGVILPARKETPGVAGRGCPSGCRGGTGQTEAAPQMQPRAGQTVNTPLPGASASCEPGLPACLPRAPVGGLAETRGVESVKELLRVNTALRPGEAVHTGRLPLLLTQSKALLRTGHLALHSSGHGSPDFRRARESSLTWLLHSLSSQPHSQVNSAS